MVGDKPRITVAPKAYKQLLHVSEETWRRQRADERLFGHRSNGTRRSGGDASHRGHLACDLRRVLTLHHCAHVGSRGEAVDLHTCSNRLRYRPGQVGRIRNIHRQYQRVSIQFRGSARRFGRKLPSSRHFRRPVNQAIEIVDRHEITGHFRRARRQGLAGIRLYGEVVGHGPVGVLVPLA
jgi:hypothetical protein